MIWAIRDRSIRRRRPWGSPAGRSNREAVMRIISMIGIVLGSLLLTSCGSTGRFIGDTLPAWAGGLPADAPPRRGTPGYQDYMRQVDGDQGQAANAPPGQAPTPPASAPSDSPPSARQQNGQPVH
jgi:hypothetical protein